MNNDWVYLRLNVDALEKKRPASARSSAQPSTYTNWASVITYTVKLGYNFQKRTEYFASLLMSVITEEYNVMINSQ